jgi:signal transduction histidine kinase
VPYFLPMSPLSRRTTPGMSLHTKLPLLISGFLLVVIALYSVASYETVKTASLDVAHQRLVSLTRQLAELFDQSAKAEEKALRKVASDTAIIAFVASSGRFARTGAINALGTGGTRPETTIRAELLDANGTTILSLQPGATERHEEIATDIEKASKGPDFAAVGRFRLINDTLAYPEIAAVLEGTRPIGFVARWRRVAATQQARDQLATLVGGNASLYMGNDRGDIWTDFVKQAPKPPARAELRDSVISEYSRAGAPPVLGASHAVPGVPWVVLVELSRDGVLAPANAFVRKTSLIGFAVVLIASLVAWFVSRSITRPLTELTQAATALASGAYSPVVTSSRSDEVGELSRAFNTMLGRVEAAQLSLEDKVRDRTEQLNERNVELETFGHSISHDLRAPLRAMHGFSQALIEDCGDQLDDAGKEYAQRIVVGAKRMDALIQDLLAYSRASRSDMSVMPVSLHDVANEAVSQVEADVASTGADVVISPGLPRVMAHRVALVQSVTNLVANGLKFVTPGRTPRITIRSEQENGKTRLWVEDTGIGIDATHHERIFGVFERLHQSEHYPGTGIGLAIVRKSVERMGGRVGVVSAAGEGSKFWIELPTAGGTV